MNSSRDNSPCQSIQVVLKLDAEGNKVSGNKTFLGKLLTSAPGSPAHWSSMQPWPSSPDELAQITNNLADIPLPDAPFGKPGTLTLERLRELANDNLDAALLFVMADRVEDKDKPELLEKIRLALVAREMERMAADE